eukprot:CAMPEP_0184685836 /NCGR_PEP_ID=MMETSP0312-20130426/20384_1 /TAXON_ID=31354 /ORGANISM="Compsopogon coeruleus, Strain SAG 36.94" /LENGTH=354 /DNA_ID=CAMNT_0027140323 /DNA_START=403 /DNA_END=1467 /DNA_ORIENTATION=+
MMDPVILLEALIYVITIVGFIREDKPRPVKSESSPSSESDSRQRAAEKETLLERIQTLEGYVQGLTNQQYDLNEKLSDREYKLEIREAELELLRMDVIEMAKQLDWMLLDTDKEKSTSGGREISYFREWRNSVSYLKAEKNASLPPSIGTMGDLIRWDLCRPCLVEIKLESKSSPPKTGVERRKPGSGPMVCTSWGVQIWRSIEEGVSFVPSMGYRHTGIESVQESTPRDLLLPYSFFSLLNSLFTTEQATAITSLPNNEPLHPPPTFFLKLLVSANNSLFKSINAALFRSNASILSFNSTTCPSIARNLDVLETTRRTRRSSISPSLTSDEYGHRTTPVTSNSTPSIPPLPPT